MSDGRSAAETFGARRMRFGASRSSPARASASAIVRTIAISNDARFEVSRRLKEDFQNGRHYYALHGQGVWKPRDIRLPGLLAPSID